MHFTVITYHLLLKALKEKSILTSRVLHRVEKLMEYNFDVVDWAGKEHVITDFLSRIYLVNMPVSEGMERIVG